MANPEIIGFKDYSMVFRCMECGKTLSERELRAESCARCGSADVDLIP